VEDLAVECGDRPRDRSILRGALEPSDFSTAHASLAAFQLNEPHVEVVSILPVDAKHNRIDDARAR
jgi:hypothetical protein